MEQKRIRSYLLYAFGVLSEAIDQELEVLRK